MATPATSDVTLRPFEAGADEARLIEVMAATFLEYGMTFEPDGWDRDVREVGTRYAGARGAFFAGCDAATGRALGFCGVDLPLGAGGPGELHRLYIDPGERGRGLGRRLCAAAEAWARASGAREMTLWSDVRFPHAHGLYARRGYSLAGQRILGDPDRSVEYGFTRPLEGPAPPRPAPGTLPEHAAGRPAGHAARLVHATSIPLARALADAEGLGHRARMVAAAILDSRLLVQAGRVRGPAHEPPHPDELFASARPASDDVRASAVLVLDGDCVVGFAGASPSGMAKVRRYHPLFSNG